MSEILQSLHLIDPDRPASDSDVENSYRLFLARGPYTPADVSEKSGLPLLSIITSLLVSEEFARLIALGDGGIIVTDDVMLAPLDDDLAAWIGTIARADTGEDGAVPDRWSAIGGLLGDDRVSHAVRAEYPRDIDALRAAIVRADEAAGIVQASPLFDADRYRGQLSADAAIARPALHYVVTGERTGLSPSPGFAAADYAARNPDVASTTVNRLAHYEAHGRTEGRLHRDWLIDHVMPQLEDDGTRPVVLLLLHEATYTGAPILGWNLVRALSERSDVVVVLRRGGALEAALRDVAAAVVAAPPPAMVADAAEMARFAERLKAVYAPVYAIANSVETWPLAIPLGTQDVPVVALVHEFWTGAVPTLRNDFYAACAALVFPARIVEQSSFDAFREVRLQTRYILPQGPCTIPPFADGQVPRAFGAPFVSDDDTGPTLADVLADTGSFTVIGLGAVEMRKGIDVFVATATALAARHPDVAFRFVWIGTWEHAIGTQYAALVGEQVRRSGLGDRLRFYPAVDDLAPIYDRADALFLSSRLDPLPNITIDAAVRGIPVVCFDQASGIAEMLAGDPDAARLVAPHLDSGAAADRIAALARDAAMRDRVSTAMQKLAQRSFNLAAYAGALDEIGRGAARRHEAARRDAEIVAATDAFEPALYFGPDRAATADTSAAAYIAGTKHLNFASPPVFGAILRRPMAGFHPFIYGMEAPDFPRDGSRDPLAHYLEREQPAGRWAHRMLRPDLAEAADDDDPYAPDFDAAAGRVAVHGHFHYPDNIADFLTALAANRLRADLFLTTTSDAAADVLRAATAEYANGDVVIDIGPNVGRDIYAFLQVLRTHLHGRYDIVGHVHGKRTIHAETVDPGFGERWRRFLWEHLLGPTHAAADVIVQAMRDDPKLGLVFPENAWLVGWEKNVESAAVLARRMGLRRPVPRHIEFPAGTMFWARTAALDALVRADFQESEMPPEPLPGDGTILHAFERMVPVVCEEAGYGYATSYIPDLGR